MDEQFDENLKKRVTEVFDNYEDTSADEGWQRLREKFPEEGKKRAVVWLWWSSAAAVLLLFFGVLWLKQTPEKQQQFTAIKKPGSTVQPKLTPATVDTQKPADNHITTPSPSILAATTDNNPALHKANNASAATRTTIKHNEPGTIVAKTNQQQPADNSVALASNQNNKVIQNNANPANNSPENAARPTENISANNTPANAIAAAKPDSPENQAPASSAIASVGTEIQKSDKPNNAVLAYNNAPAKQKGFFADKRVRFGVYAATFFNYAKGSANQFNVGAGLSADVQITKNLKLSTGVAIAQNSLSYGGHPVAPVPQGINLAPLALYSANALQYSMSEPSFKSYSASLVGIDVPVNLKYTFDPGKSETYLLAGLSSGTFLNETYTYNFAGAPAQNLPPHGGSGGFYFGRTLNLAIGTGYRFGTNRLIIEPFLKYPLDGMGAQQIRFGSGGVNLRFSIPSIKK